MSTTDIRHLELHGGQWRVVLRVPRRLVSILGKTVLKRGLKTDSLKVAQAKRWAVLSDLREIVTDADNRAAASPHDPLIADALEWRDILSTQSAIAAASGDPGEAEHLMMIKNITAAKRKEVHQTHGAAKAHEFASVVSGERTPLSSHLDRWIKETPHLARRTHGDYRRAVNRLADFAVSAGYMCTVESFDRRVAGYFSSHLASTGVHPVTANKCLSFLSAYWQWMYRKGLVSGENPWRFQSLPTPKSHRQDGKSGKRAFADDELSRLLYDGGPPESVLHDFMLIAALSGMRINEIAMSTPE